MSSNLKATEYYDLGVEYSRKSQWEKAITEFKKAIEADPTFQEAHYALGICYEYNAEGIHYGKGFRSEQAMLHYRNRSAT